MNRIIFFPAMKIWRLCLLLPMVLVFSAHGFAQDFQFKISLAEESYKDGNYPESINRYKSIIDSGFSSGELYYNLGNAYFKNRDIKSSILYYERAARLLPRDENVAFNLELARSYTTDKISGLNPFFLKVWIQYFRDLLSEKAWGIINIISLFITLGGLLIFLLSGWSDLQRWSLFIALIALFMFFSSLSLGILQKQNVTRTDEAIVFSPSVMVKSSPDEGGTNLFILHEGTKVRMMDQLGDWREIRLGDGNKGWIRISDLEII